MSRFPDAVDTFLEVPSTLAGDTGDVHDRMHEELPDAIQSTQLHVKGTLTPRLQWLENLIGDEFDTTVSLPVSRGGTGVTTLPDGQVLTGNGINTVTGTTLANLLTQLGIVYGTGDFTFNDSATSVANTFSFAGRVIHHISVTPVTHFGDVNIRASSITATSQEFAAQRMSGVRMTGTVSFTYMAVLAPGSV